MLKLDKIDRKILYQLDLNARIPLTQLAKKTRISRTVAEYRVKKLQKQGLLVAFNASLDPAKFGLTSWKVYVRFQNLTKQAEKEIYDYISPRKDLWWGIKCVGNYDLMFCLLAENAYHFYQELSDFQSKFNQYIYELNITNHIDSLMMSRGYLINTKGVKTTDYLTLEPKKEKIDKIDFKILRKLTENARTPSTKIAYELKTTARVVNYRIKDLIKRKIITNFRTVFNINKISYDYYKVMLSFKNATKQIQNSFVQFLILHKNIINTAKTYGPWDIEFELEVENYKHFNQVVKEIKDKFHDYIKKYESVLITEEINPEINFLNHPKLQIKKRQIS